MRNGENDVVMLNGQGRLKQPLDPYGLFGRLAFWAMPVQAAIVTIACLCTRITLFFMASHSSSAALDNLVQGIYLHWGQIALRYQVIPKPPDNIGQFKFSFHLPPSRNTRYRAGCEV